MKNQTLVNKDKRPQISSPLSLSPFKYAHLQSPPHIAIKPHTYKRHMYEHTVHISDCDKYTVLPQPPLSLAHVHAHTYFPLEE